MACGLGNAILEFTKLGIKIRPYELDLRHERSKFDHCRCEISQEAGELIADATSGDPNQPVNIYIDGDKILRKLYMPEGALEYDNNNKNAYIKLLDPAHVLKHGKLDKKFNQVTLKDAISYVMERFDDPNNVIEGWDITDPEYSDNYQPDLESYRDGSLFHSANDYLDNTIDYRSPILDHSTTGVLWVNRQSKNLLGISEGMGELDFQKKNPYEAMKIICEQWELDFWVNDARELLIGKREAKPNTHVVTPEDDTMNVSEYNVTEAAFPVAEVVVKGSKSAKSWDVDGDGDSDWTPPLGKTSIQMWGQSRVDGVDNGRTLTTQDKSLSEGEDLKKAAEQKLISSMSQNKSGNIIFNPAVTGFTEFAQPHTVEIGDMVVVKNPPDSCDNFDKDGGEFLVKSVNHKIRGGEGWELTVEVSLIPTKDIRSRFITYDLEKDSIVDNDERFEVDGLPFL